MDQKGAHLWQRDATEVLGGQLPQTASLDPPLPTHVLQPHRICTGFCNDSEAILSRISDLCPGGQTFLSEKHLK